ncbi:FG-GAP-like repeat-containing protein [Streptomyces sp. NPDC047928]|uniref:FG-GAP-like repeat-containing protein n=1 Tax=unclassified Streptomyces TaxID=2593676 RepID=UPI0037121EB8
MNRLALSRTGVSITLTASLAGGLLLPLAGPAVAAGETPPGVVVPATLKATPHGAWLDFAGSSVTGDGAGTEGVFHREEGLTGRQWTRYADGRTFPVAAPDAGVTVQPTGSDALAHVKDRRIELRNAATGGVAVVTVPEELVYQRTYGTTAVAYERVTRPDGTTYGIPHLLTPEADGSTRDRAVGGIPADGQLGAPLAAHGDHIVFLGRIDGSLRMVLVNTETARVEEHTAPLPDGYRYAKLTHRHIAVYSTAGTTVLVASRADLSAPFTEVTLPQSSATPHSMAVVGDWLVYRAPTSTTSAVDAVPIAGGPAVRLLHQAPSPLASGPGGTAVVVGGSGAADWGIRRITANADGTPVVSTAKELPQLPAVVQGLALSQGRLVTSDTGAGTSRYDYVRTLAASGEPAYGERTRLTPGDDWLRPCATGDADCERLLGVGDGGFTRQLPLGDGRGRVTVVGRSAHTPYFDTPEYGTITDAAGGYLVHTAAAAGRQTVYTTYGTKVLDRTPSAAALWDGALWTPAGAGTSPGTVSALDLATRNTVETVDTGSGCVPAELQALGRWLYWACGPDAAGKSGVFDRTAKKSVTVPSGDALLGDGYVVTHDRAAGKLVMTTVDTGAPVGRTIGDLPDTGTSQRHVRWTVDRFGGHAAFADAEERVHVVPSGAVTQPLALTDAVRAGSLTPKNGGFGGGAPVEGVLSKPAASWRLTLRDVVTGTVARTLSGGETRGKVTAFWDGLDDAGRPAYNGRYAWTLTAVPADGHGAPLVHTGTVELRASRARWRDLLGPLDGYGDLFTIGQDDALTLHKGTATGGVQAGSRLLWAGLDHVVPLGDMTGDECNDTLGRRPNGELVRLSGDCHTGQIFSPYQPVKVIGTGWNQWNVLMSPGDMTGDGRPDLVVRRASTGDVYLYADNGAGALRAGRKIGAAWTSYRAVFGAGDLSGDGIADVLAVDRNNALWRYDGSATGGLRPRVAVYGTGWAQGRDAFVGVGDLNKDGIVDLITRNTAGDLLRNYGNGSGGFRSTVRIGTGWQTYKGLY